ncbi:MAG: ferredoxin--NADP reductase [Phycisphaeraceae bacterium]|nr:ferredoxin--NADP reductase [Phycisphaeraceae bacterium]
MEETVFNAVMTARRDLTPSLIVVRIQPEQGSVPPFVPGQFINLGLPAPADEPGPLAARRSNRVRLTRRAYSIASSPRNADHLELLVALVQDGKLTPRLWPLDVGSRLWMDNEAKGSFTLNDVPEGADILAVASGTGIAPFMSMLRCHAGTGRWRTFILMHSVRTAAELAYRDELENMVHGGDVVYLPTLTREPADSPWTGRRGRVQLMLADRDALNIVPSSLHILLCVNPTMIEDVTSIVQGWGTVHTERYW